MHQLNNNECVRNEENRQYSEIALTEHNVANYINQLETIKQLRSFPGTSDLVLSTYDGWNEPIHSYYLALKAPKFWQSIYEQIETIITDDEQHPDSFYCIRTDENISINVPRVLVPDIEGRMLSIIVRTMYAGTVRLDYDLCWELLELANRFHLDFLISTCLDYLQRTLNINNCVLLLQTGLKFDHQLSSTSYRFILRNFIQIVRCSEVLSQLTHQQLACILADDQLNIVNEVYGWRAIVTWITHSPSERLIHFWPLFSLIRCYLLHSSAIHNEMVRDYCLLNLRNGNILSNRNVITHFRTSSTPIFNPRIPRQVVFSFGGYEHGLPSGSLRTFDIQTGKWFSMDLCDSLIRVYHALVSFGHKLFIIGGSDGLTVNNTVRMFNPITCRFYERQPMFEARCYLSAVRYRNCIVVMGGNNGTERLRTCELYEPEKNQWRHIASMNSARSDASAAVLNDKIYIAGGVEAFGLSSVEFYSFQTRTWTVVSFMNLPRRSFTLFSYHNSLYAVGGCTDVHEFTCLRSVERMNVNTNQWQFVAPLTTARSSYLGCVLDDKLFTFGGYDGFSQCKTIECYHEKTNRWEKASYMMNSELSGSAIAIITDLLNANHFTYYGQCALPGGEKVVVRPDPSRHPKRIARLLMKCSEQMRKRLQHKLGSDDLGVD